MRHADDEQQAQRLDALQTRLALEHEALWLLGVVGGRFEDLRERAEESFTDHRAVRDRLLRTITGLAADPVAARATYGTPPDAQDSAEAAVADLELRVAAASLAGLASASPRGRRSVLAALHAASLSAMDWGADPQAYPGLD